MRSSPAGLSSLQTTRCAAAAPTAVASLRVHALARWGEMLDNGRAREGVLESATGVEVAHTSLCSAVDDLAVKNVRREVYHMAGAGPGSHDHPAARAAVRAGGA